MFKKGNRLIALLLVLCLLCGLIPMTGISALAAEEEKEEEVVTPAEEIAKLQEQITAGGIVEIPKDLVLDTPLKIGETPVIIEGKGKTVSALSSVEKMEAVFVVKPGATVTFRSIILDGKYIGDGSFVPLFPRQG